jgi:hypothetical protein
MDRGLRLFVGRVHPHALPQSIFERHGPVMLFEEAPEGLVRKLLQRAHRVEGKPMQRVPGLSVKLNAPPH